MWEIWQTDGPIGNKCGTHADSSGNEYRLNIFSHVTPKGGILGVLGGQQFINLGTQLNGWTDCHKMLHMTLSAGSPGNRHKLRKIRPSRPIGGHFGAFMWKKFKSVKSGQKVGWTIINHITGCPLALPVRLPVSDGM